MSWVQSVPGSGDDVFDENGDEMHLMSKEWTTSMKRRTRDGYVDGADLGEEASLQVGFNQGFQDGAARTGAVGQLKGIVSALCCWIQMQHPGSPVPASVSELLQQISKHEEQIRDNIKKALENPAPSVSEVSDIMEVLEVDQKDPGCCSGGGCAGEGCAEEGCCKSKNYKSPEPQTWTSGSKDWSAGLKESFEVLLNRCLDLVSELGVPQELVIHIEKLRDTPV